MVWGICSLSSIQAFENELSTESMNYTSIQKKKIGLNKISIDNKIQEYSTLYNKYVIEQQEPPEETRSEMIQLLSSLLEYEVYGNSLEEIRYSATTVEDRLNKSLINSQKNIQSLNSRIVKGYTARAAAFSFLKYSLIASTVTVLLRAGATLMTPSRSRVWGHLVQIAAIPSAIASGLGAERARKAEKWNITQAQLDRVMIS